MVRRQKEPTRTRHILLTAPTKNKYTVDIMSIKPIRPEDVPASKARALPDFVIEAVNRLITKEFVGGSATVQQEDVINAILEACDGEEVTRKNIFDSGWLNFEDAYQDAGWEVEYDKPGFNETYPATFTFRKK